MADNKTYYYLKLKENFFDSEDMKLLQGMKDGYLYSDILLKLYLISLSQEGRLMYRGIIPYTPEMVATVTRHQVGTVEKAMDVLEKMGFIEILDNGAIYMLDIQNFIGQSSTEADRKREYRNLINTEKKRICGNPKVSDVGQMAGQMSEQKSDKSTPEYRDKSTEIREESLESREQSTEIFAVSKDTVSRTDVQRAVEEWNSLAVYGLKPVSKLTSGTKRAKCLNARIKEYGIDEVLAAIERIKNSDFLKGNNKRGWMITFDWFVLPNNFPKVHDGHYENSTPPPQNGGSQSHVEQFADFARGGPEMNKQEFAVIAVGIKSAYPASKILEDEASMNFWYRMLADLNGKVVENAVMEHISTSVYPPNIAEIRNLCMERCKPPVLSFDEAWGVVQRAMSEYGWYHPQEAFALMDDLTVSVVKNLGWSRLCQSENPTADRANFREAYEAKAKEAVNSNMLPDFISNEKLMLQQQYAPRIEAREAPTIEQTADPKPAELTPQQREERARQFEAVRRRLMGGGTNE